MLQIDPSSQYLGISQSIKISDPIDEIFPRSIQITDDLRSVYIGGGIGIDAFLYKIALGTNF